MHFNPNMPIYAQIMDSIKGMIIRGDLGAGERVEPVRELALSYGVNPNTIQKALSELEREGYLYSERTAGRFVTKEADRINALRHEQTEKLVMGFIQQMSDIGVKPEEMLQILDNALTTMKGAS